MSDVKETLAKLAGFLVDNDKHMSGEELADYLNRNDYKTTRGEEYKGGRGTFKLLSSLYDTFKKEGRDEDAHNVARAFTKDNDDYAYEK